LLDLCLQDKREAILKELNEKQLEKKKLVCELEKYKECDPEIVEQMKKEAIIAREAVNRWTGNVSKRCYNIKVIFC